MKDIKCPYCNYAQDIDHDDGYGYEEGELHKQECESCEKYFTFTTSIHYYYEANKADCLNGAEHKYKATRTYPIEWTRMECIDCGDERRPTEQEWIKIKKVDAPAVQRKEGV